MRASRFVSRSVLVVALVTASSCSSTHEPGGSAAQKAQHKGPVLLKSAKATLSFQNDIVIVNLSEFVGDKDTELRVDLHVWSSNADNSKNKRRVVLLTYLGDVDEETNITYNGKFKRDADDDRWNVCLRAHYKDQDVQCLYNFAIADDVDPTTALIVPLKLEPEAKGCMECDRSPQS